MLGRLGWRMGRRSCRGRGCFVGRGRWRKASASQHVSLHEQLGEVDTMVSTLDVPVVKGDPVCEVQIIMRKRCDWSTSSDLQ